MKRSGERDMSVLDSVEERLTGPQLLLGIRPLDGIVRPSAAGSRGISFVNDEGRLQLSYRDLLGQVAVAAARLRRSGVGQSSLVAMTLTNDLASVLAALATWAMGATVVSLPPPTRNSRDWYGRQFGPVLDAAGCAFLIGDESPAGLQPTAGMRRIPKRALAEPAQDRVRMPDVSVADTALIQFTSGSIGTPKGVAISGTKLAGHVASIIAALQIDGEMDRIVSWLPLYHDMGLVVMLLVGLAARADQVLTPPSTFATRPASWLTMLADERATVTAAPNFAFRLAAAVPYDGPIDLSRVRVAVCGGERVSWRTMQGFHAVAGPMGFRWGALMPSYGLSEGTVAVTTAPLGRGPIQGPDGHVSAGRPLPGVDVLVSADSRAEGPVQLGGDWLFSGYHTASGFEPTPAGAWFDTGDAGFAADGELYVIGRRDEVLTLAGRNVFAEDIELVAQQACSDLVKACAAFRNLSVTGRFAVMAEANPRLVRDRDDAVKLGRLIQAAVTKTIGSRLEPVLVVRMGAIPRTTSGKVRRAQCREIYNSGAITQRILAELG
jgi:acyl-CoA synthetase (AMP-forming)/AMP-acid ligase II